MPLPVIAPGGGTSDAAAKIAAIRQRMLYGENGPVAARADLNIVADGGRAGTIAAKDESLSLIYGQPQVTGKVIDVLIGPAGPQTYNGSGMNPYPRSWIAAVAWGAGPVESIEKVTLNGALVSPGKYPATLAVDYGGSIIDTPTPALNVRHYLGGAGAPTLFALEEGPEPWLRPNADNDIPDPWLVEWYLKAGISYSKKLPGVAYSVFVIPCALVREGMEFSAVIKGVKCFDPRNGLTAGTRNPALILADVIASPTHGAGMEVDWASVAAAANVCDEIITGLDDDRTEPRRALDIVIEKSEDFPVWLETLRTYAGCMLHINGAEASLVIDRPATPVMTLRHDDGQIVRAPKLSIKRPKDVPNSVVIIYSDTTPLPGDWRVLTPWREGRATAQLPAVTAGTVEKRESVVRLPGVLSKTQALREAVERLNKLNTATLTCDLEIFDEGAALTVGDVVAVSHPVGLADKWFRVTGITAQNGRYTLQLAEYQAAAYSAEVLTSSGGSGGSVPINPLATPRAPAAVNAYLIARRGGRGDVQISWADVFGAVSYHVTLAGEGKRNIASRVVGYQTVTFQDLQKGTYTASVRAINAAGVTGAEQRRVFFVDASAGQIANRNQGALVVSEGGTWGDTAPIDPGAPVPLRPITEWSDAGLIAIRIETSTDPQIIGYELRYGASFDSGTLLASSPDGVFPVSLEDIAGRKLWVRGKLSAGYTVRLWSLDYSLPTLPAVTGLAWTLTDGRVTWTWAAVSGASRYRVLWEVSGIASEGWLTAPTFTANVPRGAASIRVQAVAADGHYSAPLDEDIAVSGQYNYNELVSAALPITGGNYLNLAFTASNTVVRVGLRGATPVAPYAQNINDADLYCFGYNIENIPASAFENTPAAWFREEFWKVGEGFFESGQIDFGSEVSGRLYATLTKSINAVGDTAVSNFENVNAGLLADYTAADLADLKAFVAADLYAKGNTGDWRTIAPGDNVSAVRYVKAVFRVLSASPLTDITITAGTIVIDVPDVIEVGTVTAVTNAGKALVPTKTFSVIRAVLLTARGAAKAYTTAVAANSITVAVDTATPTTVDYYIKGY